MNKYSTLLLAGAVALSFASCQKDNTSGVVNPDSVVGTFASIRAAESEAGLKAVTDGQKDVEGVGAESKVASGVFFAEDPLSVSGYTAADLQFAQSEGAEKYWQTPVFKYSGNTGTVNSALVLNYNATTAGAEEKVGIENLAALTDDKGFAMTSTSATEIEIKPNVAEADVKAGNNQFDYTVERVVSKVQVVKSATFKEEFKGELSGLRYSVAGSAKEAYLFRDKAGSRTLKADGTAYEGFESAIENVALSTFGPDQQFLTRRDLTKVSDEAAKNVVAKGADDKWAALRSLPLEAGAEYQSKSAEKGIYFLENSLNRDAKEVYKYADITYVKVYAKYVPAADEVLKLEGGKLVAATQEEVAQERHETADGLTDKTYTAGSFFRGVQTKKLYLDLAAARADGNTESELYKDGMMVWKTPANRQLSDDKSETVYAETRRNNIYSLSVDAILNFGANYDPIDPDDPNVPKPTPEENPDEPQDKPQDEPVDDNSTAIQVRAAILNWNLVHRGLNL